MKTHRLLFLLPFAFAGCSSDANVALPANPGVADASAGSPDGASNPTDGGVSTPDDGAVTPPPDGAVGPTTLRFITLGDTGKGNAGQKAVADAAAAKCKADGCDFAVLLGDNIYESGVSSTTDDQWKSKFEEPYAAMPIDFYAVLGNHDYGTSGLGMDRPRGQFQVDYTAVSTKWKMPSQTYHVTKGNTELFAIDTQALVMGWDSPTQKTNVTGWLASSTSKWKIVVGHHPYISNGPHGNAGSYDSLGGGGTVKTFLEDVVCGKADLYLSGHDHSRQWPSTKCGTTELIVNGTGAEGTKLEGKNPMNYQSNSIGFVYFTADDKTLTAEFVSDTGVVQFKRVVATK